MGNYINREYLNLTLSEKQIDKLLEYGETPSGSWDAKLNQLISNAESYVDSFLAPAGYTVPLNPANSIVKQASAYHVIANLYVTSGRSVPETISDMYRYNESMLVEIQRGNVILPGKAQNVETGIGGSIMISGSGGALGSKDNLWGSFF